MLRAAAVGAAAWSRPLVVGDGWSSFGVRDSWMLRNTSWPANTNLTQPSGHTMTQRVNHQHNADTPPKPPQKHTSIHTQPHSSHSYTQQHTHTHTHTRGRTCEQGTRAPVQSLSEQFACVSEPRCLDACRSGHLIGGPHPNDQAHQPNEGHGRHEARVAAHTHAPLLLQTNTSAGHAQPPTQVVQRVASSSMAALPEIPTAPIPCTKR